MGGSQLKALKNQLKANGFIGQTNVKGKKKAARNENVKDRDQKDRVLKGIRDAFSPFDIKRSKPKVDVLGRKVDGSVGRPGISKQAGEEARRKTLLKEKEEKNKVGGIADNRFGENDPTMNPEMKMLERFTKEKQIRASKSSLFNLEDSDEEDFQLTHYGQSLSYNDDFEENDIDGSDQSDDDEETRELREMRRKRKMLARDAGITLDDDEEKEEEEEGPVKKKSKQEVMKEVIAKSKFYKFERQMAKEKDEMVIDVLDQKQNVEALLGELRNAGSFNKTKTFIPTTEFAGDQKTDEKNDNDEEYERQVRELAFERRAQAADRTKTEQEIAQEKAEKLKKLEAQRLARMNGEYDGSEEQNDDVSDDEGLQSNVAVDDNDDINDASEFGLKPVLELQKLKKSDNADDNSDSEDSDIAGNMMIDDEYQALDSDIEESDSNTKQNVKKDTVKKLGTSKTKPEEKTKVAYTFDMPENVVDLLDIFSNYPAKDQPVIVERILTLYDPRLHPDNKEKLSSFTNILAEYLIACADLVPETPEEDVAPVLDKLINILRRLAEKHTESLAEFFREQLNKTEGRLQLAISKNKNHQVTENPSHLFLFTLIAIIFSTSDHFNQIVTPASLLLGLHLSQIRLLTPTDIQAGLYVASTALTYQRLAKRYIPEIPIFLARSLYILSPSELSSSEIPHDIFLGVIDSRFPAEKNFDFKKFNLPLSLRHIHTLNQSSKEDLQNVYNQLFVKTLLILDSYMSLWTDDTAFIEIFSPFLALIKDHSESLEKLKKRLKFAQKSRIPLTLQSHKPVPIATKIPKFEENYSVDKKSYDPDVTRREHKKLLSAVKKERKGALRELRKDSHFIAREKLRERKQQDKEYHEKIDKLIRTVATEEGTEKNRYERERKLRKKKH